jgi:hypothetical protein
VSVRGASWAQALLTVAALAVAAVSAVWAWATFSYWEAGPIVATVLATSALSASALFIQRRRVLSALIVGAFVGTTNLTLVLVITPARWEG